MASKPLVVTGMHRSGTSLVASYISALGVRLGDRLLDADARNPHGYFEDADFRELNGRILVDCTPESDGGHRDWGWTEGERLDRGRLAGWTEAAAALVEPRSRRPGIWGWKDPRTSLLLDFWDGLLGGGARYLLLYRFPWEVADSMQRLGAAVFLDNPEYAARIWAFYNRQLLDFHTRHPDRSVLVSTNALLADPSRLGALLNGQLGLETGNASFDDLRDPDLFASTDPEDPLISLWAAASPDCARLLAELDANADLSAAGLWRPRPLDGRRLRPEGPVDLSVVIPCYDHGELLLDAVASAERSAPPSCELIVVNDGSRQPRTLEVLAALRDGGYHVIDQPNSGLAAARNRGIEASRGRYVLPLDADNRLLPGFPAAAAAILDAHPEAGVAYGDRIEFGSRSGRVQVPGFDLDTLLWTNSIDACAVYRREVWEGAGGYDAGAPAWEDWELWISAAERGWRFLRLDEPTFEYRVRPNSMLAEAEREGVRRPVREHIYRKHAGLYRERFSGVLLAGHAQVLEIARDALALRASRDHIQAEIDRLAAVLDPLRVERDGLARRLLDLGEQGERNDERNEAEKTVLREELTALREQGEALREQWESLRGNLAALREENTVLGGELAALRRDLAASRDHIAFMEGTRAWRWRDVLVRWKHRIRTKH